jgi:hypothetical protein
MSVSEFPNGFTQGTADLGNFTISENDQQEEQYNDQLRLRG